MSRKSTHTNSTNEVTDNSGVVSVDKPIRTRTPMFSARIVVMLNEEGIETYDVMLNREVTAEFTYYPSSNSLIHVANNRGYYDGIASYFRKCPDCGKTLLITKSPDYDVVSAQADRYTAEQFIKNYIDRRAAVFEVAQQKIAELESETQTA